MREKGTKKSVSIDLAEHIATCELNYVRLLTLLPGLMDGRGHWAFEAGTQERIKVDIRLIQSAPYTSVVEITQKHPELELPRISLRLAHDADVAEVISWDGHRYWQPKYDYPNPQMYQPDEKLALNRFISDWLEFCRINGLMNLESCDSLLVTKK